MMFVPALSAVMFLTAMLRLVPGTLWPVSSSDMGYHLLLRREIRRNRMRMPGRVTTLMLDEHQTYPWFYHWVLAFVPEKWLERLPMLPSTVVDIFHSGLVFGLAAWLAPQAQPELNPVAAGLAAGLLFGTSPALLAIGIGPRAYEVTPRPFGELLFSITIVAIGFYLIRGSAWALAAAALAAALMLLSSKFAAQVLVFCVPISALITKQWLLFLLPLAAVGAALLLSGGRYWRILAAQVAHLRLYRTRLQYEHPSLLRRNQWRCLWDALTGIVHSRFRERTLFVELLRFVEQNTYIQFFIRNVLWCGVFLLTGFGLFPNWADAARPWELWLWSWALAPVFPFILSSLRGWRFLGEAERYPEYGLLPVCILTAVGMLRLPNNLAVGLFVAYVGLTLPILVSTFLRKRVISHRDPDDTLSELVNYLKTLPPGAILLTIPSILSFAVAYRLEHQFLASADASVWMRDYDRIFCKYPWPSTNFHWWRQTHRMEFVVVMTAYLSSSFGCEWDYDFTGFRQVFTNQAYLVYQTCPLEGQTRNECIKCS